MSNKLIGKKIKAVHLDDDKESISFETEDGESIVARCDGDCCSRTWIEHIEGMDYLIGATVANVEDIEMNREPTDADYTYTQYYGCRITTDKGHCIIDYRNESNGYYGGSLDWPS